MSLNMTGFNFSTNNTFMGYVKDNDIYTYTGELIGVNLAKYQEVEKALKKCRDKLVELGVIVPAKKPEEIIKEQGELLKKQTELCNSLMVKMQEMTEKIGVLNNGFEQNKIDNTITSDTAREQTTSFAGVQPSGSNSQPASELHNGRGKKTSSTK